MSLTRERISYFDLVPSQIKRAAEITRRAPFTVVLDLDEAIWETVMRHYEISTKVIPWLFKREGIECPNLPTYEEICRRGGTVPGFKGVISNELNLQLNRAIRHSKRHQRGLPLLHPGIPNILANAKDKGFVTALYLTTRPDETAEVSLEELVRLGFPDLPLLARPDQAVTLSETTFWKLAQLTTLAELTPGKVVMIDDSTNLSNAIRELNHPKIASVLFQGPITNMDDAPPGAPSANWDTMLETIQTFQV